MTTNFENKMESFCDLSINKTQKDAYLSEIRDAITKKIVDLNSAVKFLGPYLTSEDENTRGRGYEIFWNVIDCVEDSEVSDQNTTSMMKFYANRLNDFLALPDLIPGALICFIKLSKITQNDAANFMIQLFAEVSVMSLSQPVRYQIFQILDKILSRFPEICKDEFVQGFITSMDGERDPINLLFLFKMIPKITKIAGECVEYFAEEFFDVICCYYPISFKTDDNDPRGITAKDLADSLKEAMNCTPLFAPFAIPFYLEKLSSSQVEVKSETLELLGEAALNFGRKELIAFASELWPSLKTELLRSANNEILDICLVTIGKVCKALCEGEDTDRYKLNSIAGLTDSAVKELMSPESKMAPLYALMLKSACITSYQSCRLIFNHIIPQIIGIFHDYDGRDKKSGCLTMFSRLLESIYSFDNLKETELIKEIYEIVRESFLNEDIKSESINALTRLVLFPKFVDIEKEFEIILTHLFSNEKIRESTLLSLEWTSEKNPKIVTEFLIQKLSENFNDNEKEINEIYEYFGKNCSSLHSELVFNLFSTLELLSKEKNFEKIDNLLNSIETISKNAKNLKVSTNSIDIIVGCVEAMVLSGFEMNESLVKKLSSIMLNLQKSLSSSDQKDIIDRYLEVSLFKSYDENIHKITLIQSILIGLQSSIEIPKVNILLDLMMEFSIKSKSNLDSMNAAHTIGCIINKSTDLNLIQEFSEKIVNFVEDEKLILEEKKKAIYTFSWILKAIVMSGKTKISDSMTKVASKLLTNPEIASESANIYEIVLSENSLLNKSTFARVQVLYKQRFFSVNLHGLLSKLKESKENEFPVLLAVANMIKHIPHSVLLNDINNIFPIVVKALSSEEKRLISAGIKTVLVLIQQSKDKVVENLNTIIKSLLNCTKNMESMEIRILSLKCLQEIAADYPFVFIFPYQNDILEVLDDVLDDPKRKVRAEAVICNHLWFGIKDGN
eukprot:gene802-9052_t